LRFLLKKSNESKLLSHFAAGLVWAVKQAKSSVEQKPVFDLLETPEIIHALGEWNLNIVEELLATNRELEIKKAMKLIADSEADMQLTNKRYISWEYDEIIKKVLANAS
jgi:hypothetical protein